MLPECEVKWCKKLGEHTVGILNTTCGVCTRHKDKARELSRKHSRELFEARADIVDKFVNGIYNIKEEE